MRKRILGLIISAALLIGLTSLQASALIDSQMTVIDTKVATEQFEVIDFIWPCEFPWQTPPLCL